MFKRFHQKSHNNSKATINHTSYQQINKNKSTLHTKYSEKHKNRLQTPPQQNSSANLQIIKTDNFIFQGFIKNNMKQGEGVMMMKNGTIVFGTWVNDLLEGRALIFTSLGCKIMAHFILGKFNGWTLAVYKDRIVKCILFYQNYLDSEKITYDDKEKLWVSAKCTYDGKLISINHVEKGHLMELPSFIHSEELKELIASYILNREAFVELQHIENIENGQSSSYIGFADQQKKPLGLGLIYNSKEIYCGNFFEGVLEHYGRMIFENGEIYHGEMLGGVFWGRGIYYSPVKNQTHILSTNEHDHTVEKQLEGYYMINIVPNLGGTSTNSFTGIKGQTLKAIQESFEPYYIKQYASKHKNRHQNHNEESNNSEFGHSQEMNQSSIGHNHNINQRTQSTPFDKIKPQQKWLKFQEQNPDIRKRTYSLDKRQVAYRKKDNFEIKIKPSNQYESIQIKENVSREQAEDFQKQAPPATKIMQQIKFNNEGFKMKKQSKGLEVDNTSQQPQKRGQIDRISKITQQPNSQSSQISNDWQKLQKLIERNKNYRKKIFY